MTDDERVARADKWLDELKRLRQLMDSSNNPTDYLLLFVDHIIAACEMVKEDAQSSDVPSRE